VADSFELDNEPSSSKKVEEYLDQLNDSRVPEKYCVPWS
jgi:hypothetical protein